MLLSTSGNGLLPHPSDSNSAAFSWDRLSTNSSGLKEHCFALCAPVSCQVWLLQATLIWFSCKVTHSRAAIPQLGPPVSQMLSLMCTIISPATVNIPTLCIRWHSHTDVLGRLKRILQRIVGKSASFGLVWRLICILLRIQQTYSDPQKNGGFATLTSAIEYGSLLVWRHPC